MRISRWMPKDTDTHSEYVILIAFSLQKWLNESATILRYQYVACLSLKCPERPWRPPSFLFNGYRGYSPHNKTATTWNWSFTVICYQGYKCADFSFIPLRAFVFCKRTTSFCWSLERERKTHSTFYFMFFVPCVVIKLCKVNQQNALLKLMFYFNFSSLLHVSNILCSSSGRLYCTCSLMLYVYNTEITMNHCIQGVFKKDRTFAIKTLFYILSTVPFQVVPSTGDTPVPNVSSIVKMLPGTHFPWWRAVLLSHFPESPRVQNKNSPIFLKSSPISTQGALRLLSAPSYIRWM
jgi:hypothetical protein